MLPWKEFDSIHAEEGGNKCTVLGKAEDDQYEDDKKVLQQHRWSICHAYAVSEYLYTENNTQVAKQHSIVHGRIGMGSLLALEIMLRKVKKYVAKLPRVPVSHPSPEKGVMEFWHVPLACAVGFGLKSHRWP